jgi:hypothetical protein
MRDPAGIRDRGTGNSSDASNRRGVTAFHVDCAPQNASFYEKCGFKMGAGGWMDLAGKP